MKVGFIGLGTMGRNAALNVRRAGYDMVVFDVRPDALKPLLETGAQAGKSPADVLDRCDIVVTMVFGPKEVEQVVRGESGFLATRCQGKTWIDMTTSSPKLMRALAAEFQAKGGGPVDATFKAIESIAGSGAELLLYSVNAITTGTDAQGEVTTRLSRNDRIVNGNGADTDIVIASARSYLNALNKLHSSLDKVKAQGDV